MLHLIPDFCYNQDESLAKKAILKAWWGNFNPDSSGFGRPWTVKDSSSCYKEIYSPKGGKKQKRIKIK